MVDEKFIIEAFSYMQYPWNNTDESFPLFFFVINFLKGCLGFKRKKFFILHSVMYWTHDADCLENFSSMDANLLQSSVREWLDCCYLYPIYFILPMN